MSLRVANAYHTVSHDALCVIPGMVSIGILNGESIECIEVRGIEPI